LRRYKAKRVKTRCYQERVGHFEPRFQDEGVAPGEYFLVSTKLDTFCWQCKLHRATCRRFDTIYRRVTDGQTDRRTDGRTHGIAVASTALAMRRAVKSLIKIAYRPNLTIYNSQLAIVCRCVGVVVSQTNHIYNSGRSLEESPIAECQFVHFINFKL